MLRLKTMQGKLTVTLLSDACFSKPTSRGASVDVDIASDATGLPIINGKTLRGLLKDIWLSSRDYLDPEGLGAALFGLSGANNEFAVLRIGDAGIPQEDRLYVEHAIYRKSDTLPKESVLEAFSATRMLTSEDQTTGAPARESLRAVRVVPSGAVFHAPITTARDLTPRELDLLNTLLSLIRHAGSSRNRGMGYVKIEAFFDHCAKAPQAISPQAILTNSQTTQFIPYEMHLTAPCIITAQRTDPNSTPTCHYIPGSTIRGAIASQLIKSGVQQDRIAEILNSGKIRFLNAYPAVGNKRSLPTPNTWTRNKDASLIDSEAEPRDDINDLLEGYEVQGGSRPQREPLQTKFYADDLPVVPKTYATMHQRRIRATGTTSKQGLDTVFIYEALEADQKFVGLLAVESTATELVGDVVNTLRSDNLVMGRSLTAGYGGAPKVKILPLRNKEEDSSPGTLAADDQFLVVLTADALLRDPMTGRFDPWQLAGAIGKRFDGIASVIGAAVTTSGAGGYNRLWRTEVPYRPAAAAGSTVILQAQTSISEEDMAAISSGPMGEGVTDGFGCFTIRNLSEPKLGLQKLPEAPRAKSTPTGVPTSTLIAAQQRLYRKQLRILITRAALKLKESARGLPSAHLINRLRVPLRDKDWHRSYSTWLNEKGEKSLRPRQLASLRDVSLDSGSLLEWLEKQSTAGLTVPHMSETCRKYRLLPQDMADAEWKTASDQLQTFYIETVLNMLAKKAKEASAV
jgi:hypothetical protein